MTPSAEVLAWALVHFIWQGAALALIAFFAMRWLRLPAEGRYVVGILTLAVMLASPVVTYAVLTRDAAPIETTGGGASGGIGTDATAATPDLTQAPAAQAGPAPRATLLLLAAWLLGVAVFSMRLAGGWVVARRMVTRGVRPVTPEIALLARRVAGRLALDRAVRVIESSAVSVPVMVGWLKPIVLLPAVALSGLTPTQIEALIAHELAHVRRHDYVVNLLQAAVETLLFYHPAVWWVSKQVRTEREHCCDDLAVRVCDRLVYVSALSDLAAMGIPKTALAATGGSLLARVRRILGAGDSAASNGGAWVPALVALVVLGAVAPAWGAGVLTESTGPSAHALNAAVIEEAGAKQAPPAVPAADALDTQLVPIPALPHFPTVFEALSAQGGSPQDERALAALIEQIQKQSGNEKLKEKLEIDRRRLELERARAESDAVMRLKTAEFELAELVKTHSRMSQLRENGLIAGDELAKLERRMQELEARLMNEREQMSLRIKERALEREAMAANQATLATTREADLARLYAELHAQTTARASRERQITEAQAAELERLAKQYQEVIEAFKATRAQEMAQLQERARVVQGRAEAVRPSRERMLLAETVPVTSEKEPIRSGDVLSIEISGESGLPTAYAVQTDGTVRLPILGSIKVAGLTAQQAGEAIRKQVARVNSSASVHVTLRRPRTEERRQR